jgi:hypothetical protein
VPPKDICLYEYHFISDVSGGERPRSTEEKFVSPKEVFLHSTFYVDVVTV